MKFSQATKEIKGELNDFRSRLIKSFIAGAYSIHSGIVQKFYSATPSSKIGVARRTGNAAKSWKVNVSRNNDTVICSIYSAGAEYADFSQKKVIKPKSKKWLAIPVNAALTKNGAARYPGGPRQAARALSMPPVKRRMGRLREGERDPLKFYKKDEENAFLIAKPGVRGTGLNNKNRIMFVLKKQVTKPDRTRGLMPWVDKRVNTIVSRLANVTGKSFSMGE